MNSALRLVIHMVSLGGAFAFMQVGDYKLIRRTGDGTGALWQAMHVETGELYAVRILPEHCSADAAFVQQFLAQSDALRRLKHPHLVLVYDARQDEKTGQLYRVMDWMRGPVHFAGMPAPGRKTNRGDPPSCSLEDLMQANGGKPLPADEVHLWALQIADALAYIHSHGLVHGNVTPANVLISRHGNAKLTDFGWGREEEPSPACDVYAFGALLYPLLTGASPTVEMVSIRTIVPNALRCWDRICRRCLQRDPNARYANGAELAKSLPPYRQKRFVHIMNPRQILWTAATVLVVAGFLVFAIFHGNDARRKRAEQMDLGAKALAAEQALIIALIRTADSAVSAGDYDTAGELLAELEGKEMASAAVVGLRKRYDSRFGQHKTGLMNHAASGIRDQIITLPLDAQEQMRASLQDLGSLWQEAATARQSRSWQEAIDAYRAYITKGKKILDAEVLRQAALVARSKVQNLAETIQRAGIGSKNPFLQTAISQSNKASELFTAGKFADAAERWKAAHASYDAGLEHHQKSVVFEDTYASLHAAFERERARLMKFHPDACDDLGGQLLQSEKVAATNPVLSVAMLEDIGSALDKAVAKADNTARRYKINMLLDMSITSAGHQDWHSVYQNLRQLLLLDPSHSEAKAMLSQAERELHPEPGRNWISPSTGWEFIWIAQLQIWVCQYEVTNEALRKMATEHDSGSYEGYSLNAAMQPGVQVDLNLAVQYADWLSIQDLFLAPGYRYRLPSRGEHDAMRGDPYSGFRLVLSPVAF